MAPGHDAASQRPRERGCAMKPSGSAWLGRTHGRGIYHVLQTLDLETGKAVAFCGKAVSTIARGSAADRALADSTSKFCPECVRLDALASGGAK